VSSPSCATTASADRPDLLRLLLQQTDRHPPGAVDGVDLADADPALVERLLAEGILTEEDPLQDIAPDRDGQDGLPRPIWRRGDKALALSLEGESAPEPIDPRELVQYPIDVLRLCSAIRNDNDLTGSGPEVLSPRTILIGWKGDAVGRRPVVLCRLLRDGNAYEVVHMLTSRLNADRLILLTPTERTLAVDVLNNLSGRGVEIVPALLALQDSVTHPFLLRMEGWATPARWTPDATIALLIDTSGNRAFFFGHELELRPREFKVLVELARAFPDGGYVSRDQLYDAVYPPGHGGEARPYDEQITDTISRLRVAFKKAGTATGRPLGKIIENKRKVGYRLTPGIGQVQSR
jgi:DNA-binding winged helix-turn-helix (wHTH) protein